jgi:transcriptional regulator of heat shock response
MMDARTEHILSAVIQEYIATGEPVSSSGLYRARGFSVKPATIRNEMSALAEQGYLCQPHTSSGRVPTDKGYRFFAESVLAQAAASKEKRFKNIFSEIEREFARGEFDEFIEDLAVSLKVIGIGYEASGDVHKSGMHDFFGELVEERGEFGLTEAHEIIRDVEMIDERMGELLDVLPREDQPSVFVGESPITRSPHLAVIADRFDCHGGEFILAILGPKRMDYEGNIRFFAALKRAVN